MEKNFIRVRSIKDIVISLILIISGCLLAVLPTSTPLSITGFFLIFAGLLLMLLLKSAYKDAQDGGIYKKSEHYFASDQRENLMKALTAPEKTDLKEEDKGNGLKLDVYYSKKTGKVFLQLFEYVPYKYEACSEVHEHEYAKAEKYTR